MSLGIGRFLKDRRGTSFEGIALSVSIIAVAFVASADVLDYMTKAHEPAGVFAALRSGLPANVRPVAVATVAGDSLDDTPTGSLPKLITRSVLDPCTGQVK